MRRLIYSTHHSEMKLGGNVPVFDTPFVCRSEGIFPDDSGRVRGAAKEMNAFLLRGHGQATVAGTMREAAYLAELVEETAQISLLAGR
ncbi:MAG: class II aldolase/adducin family protein [Clostridium fessum]